ncbi:hypothetical protein M0R45_021251 [Rubus argutus]|uniref:ABC transporter domain-containing protein n=1 Tax=Rubus argutus TaxID=59490 RepID=A0AAW1XD48_RUBAR
MAIDMIHANYYMGSLFYALLILLVDGFPELAMTVSRIVVFYKQKELCFYPAWAYAIPAAILKIPLSFLEAFVWTILTYYVIGYSPEVGRFFRHFLLLFAVHLTSISMFRFIASIFQTVGASMTAGSSSILSVLLFGGFVIPKSYMPVWLKWGYWVSPLTYGEIGITVNEFLAPRWEKVSANTTLGKQALESRGLHFDGYFYWISVGALMGFTLLFNIGFTLALTFLKSPGKSLSLVSYEKYHQLQGKRDDRSDLDAKGKSTGEPKTSVEPKKGRMVLPFEPLTVSFQDVQYYVDTPLEMRKGGFEHNKLQLLSDITGAFRPGVLTALMGVSGAGKTTLMDVLCGRKTGGIIEGEIRIGGYPKIDSKTKAEFVNEVLETIELDGIKDSLVGMAGVGGLSTEQRRTVVCTIHQPSIDIFEAFDELILMKTGGRIIYSGQLGQHSSRVIEYLESIPGVPSIKDNYNPATWMLEVTSKSAEADLGIDFAQIYRESALYENNQELVKQLSSPSPGSKDLEFPTRYPQNGWGQFKACFWKQNLSYWRSPTYNLTRILFICSSSLLFGTLFWNQGEKINNQQELFNVFGSMFAAIIFFGINNCSTVLPFVATERNVLYRERYAGMFSSWAYSFAQVLVELPYSFTQAVLYVVITYPMIGYHWSAYKIFWVFYSMFCTILCFNYLGMLLVSLTPNVQVASIVASSAYTMLTLFSGFIVPGPKIPKWWLWLYYLCPTSWALNGMLTSQYGDVQKEVVVFGETKTVAAFLQDYFGYHHHLLGLVAVVLLLFPIVFAFLFAYFIGKLNFQRR